MAEKNTCDYKARRNGRITGGILMKRIGLFIIFKLVELGIFGVFLNLMHRFGLFLIYHMGDTVRVDFWLEYYVLVTFFGTMMLAVFLAIILLVVFGLEKLIKWNWGMVKKITGEDDD